ncbi:MAG: Na(+)/H(+) antiporter subunit D [Akkermansiaceae bacterium]|nr:Na(+)/H(+) antiporter subunit D [Akkermansiaceae bacterium]
MIAELHPAAILVVGGVLAFFLPGRLRQVWCVGLPVLGLVNMLGVQHGATAPVEFMGHHLEWLRVDKLSWLFGLLFHIAAVIAAIYSLHVKDRVQLGTAMLYAGSAVGAVFAGDLLTLFVFWELLAVTSVFQVWGRRNPAALGAGLRYLLVHVASGLLVLIGLAMHYRATGSLAFGHLGLESEGGLLIFMGFGIKCAFPLVHTWLVDAYPAATPSGALYLCSFTTKVAVYAMARGFAGEGVLIGIGALMAMFPIFYAVIENDLRRVLGYSMINQIGFMMVGIGIGTPLALNGAVAHAFNDVLFKGLLFMSMGAVLYRTGKINGSDLGGLYKSMPWTAGFCMVGAASISAFPLFSGFVSKSMVMSAAADGGMVWVWLALLFAAAGVFHHAGIKIPFFAFFAHDSGIRTKEAPWHMLLAMGLGAALCIGIGCFPQVLYGLLPWEADYHPYTITHVLSQTQLLFFSALAFVSLMLLKIYPPELRSVNLDADWFWRKGGAGVLRAVDVCFNGLNRWAHAGMMRTVAWVSGWGGDAPARLVGRAAGGWYRLQGVAPAAREERAARLAQRCRDGGFRVGLMAGAAVLMVAAGILWFRR